jgi:hypothetical protein
LLQTLVVALDEGHECLLVDLFEGGRWFGFGAGQKVGDCVTEVGWMDVATESVVVGGWDCVVVVVSLLGNRAGMDRWRLQRLMLL